MSLKNNPSRRTAKIWAGIAVLGIIVVFIPWMIGLDGDDGGFALSFLGVFIVLVGIIAAIIYHRLARALDRITRDENILAHWTYSPAEWQEYTEKEQIEDAADRKKLFIMIAVITVLVGLILWAIMREHPEIILFIVLGIIAITGLTAFITARANYRQNKNCQGEARISLDGVSLGRQLHLWKGIGNSLESVVYDDADPSRPRLIFEYSSPARQGRNYYTARVPVPPGQAEAAKKIVAEIAAAHLRK
jgi:type II secretory pathway pseudopilin PulG